MRLFQSVLYLNNTIITTTGTAMYRIFLCRWFFIFNFFLWGVYLKKSHVSTARVPSARWNKTRRNGAETAHYSRCVIYLSVPDAK